MTASATARSSRLATASLVLGIIAAIIAVLTLAFIPAMDIAVLVYLPLGTGVALIAAIIGLIFGIVALAKHEHRQKSLTGLIISAVVLIGMIICYALIFGGVLTPWTE